ncbi:hypothetical protein Cfor_08269, partial [Coptotermes formosanus]
KRQVIYAGHAQLRREPKGQDLNKVPGRAGVDYPIFHTVPDTNFHCGNVPAVPGIYANIETGCQVEDRRRWWSVSPLFCDITSTDGVTYRRIRYDGTAVKMEVCLRGSCRIQ